MRSSSNPGALGVPPPGSNHAAASDLGEHPRSPEDQVFVAMGVVFVWGVGPILDIVMGESKVARPPRESGTPFEVLLWAHGILQLVVVGTFFWFAANEGLTWWLVVGGLSSGLSAASSAIVTAHELGHKKRGARDGGSPGPSLLGQLHALHLRAQPRPPQVGQYGQGLRIREGRPGLWSFWLSTIPGQFVSSASVHSKRGGRASATPLTAA